VISSFYEFKTAGEEALTTEAWLRELDGSPPRPQWVSGFLEE